MVKGWSLQQMVLGNWTFTCKKNETGALTYTTHRNQLKMNEDSHIPPKTIKLLERNTGESFMTLVLAMIS